MNYGRVYCVTNKLTGEQYVGQTKRTVKKRAELGISFLSGKHAAKYLGVLKTSVANAVKSKGKVLRKYTLVMVA